MEGKKKKPLDAPGEKVYKNTSPLFFADLERRGHESGGRLPGEKALAVESGAGAAGGCFWWFGVVVEVEIEEGVSDFGFRGRFSLCMIVFSFGLVSFDHLLLGLTHLLTYLLAPPRDRPWKKLGRGAATAQKTKEMRSTRATERVIARSGGANKNQLCCSRPSSAQFALLAVPGEQQRRKWRRAFLRGL